MPSGVANSGSKKTTQKKGDKSESESENKGAGWQVGTAGLNELNAFHSKKVISWHEGNIVDSYPPRPGR